MKLLTLIIIFLFTFAKANVGRPIISSTKIVVSPSLNFNCTMGTIRVCHDSQHRLCHCKIDFDSSPLKTAKKCTNGTNLQWLENSKKFTPTCMKIYDPKKPLNCPFGYRLTNYTTNSSILVPYCTKDHIFRDKRIPRIPFKSRFNLIKHSNKIRIKSIRGNRNNYLFSPETKIRLGLIPKNITNNKNN